MSILFQPKEITTVLSDFTTMNQKVPLINQADCLHLSASRKIRGLRFELIDYLSTAVQGPRSAPRNKSPAISDPRPSILNPRFLAHSMCIFYSTAPSRYLAANSEKRGFTGIFPLYSRPMENLTKGVDPRTTPPKYGGSGGGR